MLGQVDRKFIACIADVNGSGKSEVTEIIALVEDTLTGGREGRRREGGEEEGGGGKGDTYSFYLGFKRGLCVLVSQPV